MQTTIERTEPASDFRALAVQVRAAGLLDRRLGYYWTKILVTVTAFGAGWAALFVLRGSWSVLGVAAFLGVASGQLGFLGHDAGHGQVFASRRANRLLGLVVGNGLVGLSFGWWVAKHSAHHAHPNQPDLDPDIGVGLVGAHSAEDAAGGRSGLAGWLTRWQVELFFPLMLLRSTGLYLSGGQDLLRRRNRAALVESFLVVTHAALYLAAIFWVLPLPEAVAFVVVHQAVFSVYLGCSFAPNHKGMPIIEEGSEMGFARRQVVTARNVSGGRCTGFVLGGLNYQIEHHLFPTMPRPNLARVQGMVRAFCSENRLTYCEARPIASYRQAVRRPCVA